MDEGRRRVVAFSRLEDGDEAEVDVEPVRDGTESGLQEEDAPQTEDQARDSREQVDQRGQRSAQ
jgi:hypothetical protein